MSSVVVVQKVVFLAGKCVSERLLRLEWYCVRNARFLKSFGMCCFCLCCFVLVFIVVFVCFVIACVVFAYVVIACVAVFVCCFCLCCSFCLACCSTN